MTEDEYIVISDLARLRMIQSMLGDMIEVANSTKIALLVGEEIALRENQIRQWEEENE